MSERHLHGSNGPAATSLWQAPLAASSTSIENLLGLRSSEIFASFGTDSASQSLRQEWQSLTAERDPRFLGEQLLAFADRALAVKQAGAAGLIYQGLTASDALPPELRRTAEARGASLRGGSWSEQLPVLLPQLLEDSLSLRSLGAMAGASLVGKLAYAGIFSKVASQSRLLAIGGKSGAELLAGIGALACEAPAFAALSHRTGGDFSNELGSAFVFLGTLRASQVLNTRALRLGGETSSIRTWLTPRVQSSLTQISSFAGIVGANHLLRATGLRTGTSEGWLAESLATYFNVLVSDRISHAVLGPRYQQLLAEIEQRSQASAARPGIRASWSFNSLLPMPAFASAMAPSGKLFAGPEKPTLMAMATNKGSRGSSGRTTSTTAKKSVKSAASQKAAERRERRKRFLREADEMIPVREQIRNATNHDGLPTFAKLNRFRDPGIYYGGWLELVEAFQRLGSPAKDVKRWIARHFDSPEATNAKEQKENLLIYFAQIVERESTPAPVSSAPAALAATGESTPVVIATEPPARPPTPVPPKPAANSLKALYNYLEAKARQFGHWKPSEMLAVQLMDRLNKLRSEHDQQVVEMFFTEVLKMMDMSSIGSGECFHLLKNLILVADGKLDGEAFQKMMDVIEEGGLKALANQPAPQITVPESPLLGIANSGLVSSPIEGKLIRSRGLQGVVECIRRYNSLGDFFTDAELRGIAVQEAEGFHATLGGLEKRRFREGILMEPLPSNAELGKSWNIGASSASGIVADLRRRFTEYLAPAMERFLIEKHAQATQTKP